MRYILQQEPANRLRSRPINSLLNQLKKTQRIRHQRNPEWGLGELLDVNHWSGFSAFFEWAGERCTIKGENVIPVLEADSNSVILDAFRIHGNSQAGHSVYVIELNNAVLEHGRFRDRNPQYEAGKPCVYVGSTGLSVEQRFLDHKNQHHDGAFVFQYGERLLYSLFEELNPRRWEVALATEFEFARKLRNQGYGVWQG